MFKTWISGGIAGVVLWTAIFPADVIKSRQQVSIRVDMVGTNQDELLTYTNAHC